MITPRWGPMPAPRPFAGALLALRLYPAAGCFLQWLHVSTRPVFGRTRCPGAPTRRCCLGSIAPSGQSERRATGRRHPACGPRAHPGWRRLGQDARAHHAYRLAAAKRLCHARRHSGRHLYQQGRQGNGGPPVGHAARQRARHVDWHFSRPVQPPFTRAPQGGRPGAVVPDPRHARPALGHQAPVQAAQRGRRAFSAQAAGLLHCPLQGRRHAPRRCAHA